MVAIYKSTALKSVVDVVTTIVLIAAASTVIYRNVIGGPSRAESKLKVPSEPLSLDGATVRGSRAARAVLIVYSDFECPFCKRFVREVLPEIERRYIAQGTVALALHHLPLTLHPHARQAAATADCAGRQGKFWEMHDGLFAEAQLNDAVLRALPKSIGLDERAFEDCLGDRTVGEKIGAGVTQARELGIRATPAFFLGTWMPDGRVKVLRTLSGARPLKEFERELIATLEEESGSWRLWMSRIVS